MPPKTAQEIFDEQIGPNDPGRDALARRLLEIKKLREQGDPAFQTGSKFLSSRQGRLVRDIFDAPGFLDPTDGGGGFSLTFAQTEAGARLAASLARETDRIAGRERLKLEGTFQALAMELLPPKDVDTAMLQVRRGELVKSKLAFQAGMQGLSDEAQNEERRQDLDLAEENERRTLRQARSRITVDMIGKDLGRAILFALSGSGGGG